MQQIAVVRDEMSAEASGEECFVTLIIRGETAGSNSMLRIFLQKCCIHRRPRLRRGRPLLCCTVVSKGRTTS